MVRNSPWRIWWLSDPKRKSMFNMTEQSRPKIFRRLTTSGGWWRGRRSWTKFIIIAYLINNSWPCSDTKSLDATTKWQKGENEFNRILRRQPMMMFVSWAPISYNTNQIGHGMHNVMNPTQQTKCRTVNGVSFLFPDVESSSIVPLNTTDNDDDYCCVVYRVRARAPCTWFIDAFHSKVCLSSPSLVLTQHTQKTRRNFFISQTIHVFDAYHTSSSSSFSLFICFCPARACVSTSVTAFQFHLTMKNWMKFHQPTHTSFGTQSQCNTDWMKNRIKIFPFALLLLFAYVRAEYFNSQKKLIRTILMALEVPLRRCIDYCRIRYNTIRYVLVEWIPQSVLLLSIKSINWCHPSIRLNSTEMLKTAFNFIEIFSHSILSFTRRLRWECFHLFMFVFRWCCWCDIHFGFQGDNWEQLITSWQTIVSD